MENYSAEISTELKQLITAEQAWHYRVVPQMMQNGFVTFLTDSPIKIKDIQSEIDMVLGLKSNLVWAKREIVDSLLSKYYQLADGSIGSFREGDSSDFILKVISEASRTQCSDIHFEPLEMEGRIRFRSDGELKEKYKIPKSEYVGLVNRIKILAHLDISEKRLPQDGRILINESTKFDIRVSIIPTIYGEKIVLRLLGSDASHLNVSELGFSERELTDFLECLKKTKGIILISGPTGSGKTTTLYATLKILNTGRKNILTVEDPVEYTLDGISQVQAKEDIGLTFNRVLRSFLRQDPDIIMLGEIRDEETAKIAIRLALTGHLVLSTIHTNSAWGTISRLEDMGIPPYLLADTLIATLAQRLVKKLCPHCKEKCSFDSELLPRSYQPQEIPSAHFISVGCKSCYFTGYIGRKAIYEVIAIDHTLSNSIKMGEVFQFSFKERGIRDLKSNAYQLFLNGITSLHEIYPILVD